MDYRETDPEFAERFEHFAFEEVVREEGPAVRGNHTPHGDHRHPSGVPGIDEFKTEHAALDCKR